jgi:hypothetical protein
LSEYPPPVIWAVIVILLSVSALGINPALVSLEKINNRTIDRGIFLVELFDPYFSGDLNTRSEFTLLCKEQQAEKNLSKTIVFFIEMFIPMLPPQF